MNTHPHSPITAASTHQDGPAKNTTAFKHWIGLLVLAGAIPLLQGCAALIVGGVAAGAAYGTVEYVNNTLRVTHNLPLDQVWVAANGTLKDMKMPVISEKKDASTGTLRSRNALDQPVTIEARRVAERVTEVLITVGTFDSASNRAIAQQIHGILKAKL